MRSDRHHIILYPKGLFIQLSLALLFIIFLIPAYAQNTKGDQPDKSTRETRFGNKSKKAKKSKSGGDKRVQTKGKTKASSGARSSGDRERAWRGDITGRKIPSERSQTKQNKNVFPQRGRTVTRSPSQSDDAQTKVSPVPGTRVKPRSTSGQSRNVYPQRGPYVRSSSPPQRDDPGKRIRTGASAQTKIRSTSGRASNVYPQKGPYVAKTSPPPRGDSPKKWTGSIARSNVRTATGTTKNTFPQRGPYVAKTRPPQSGDAPISWRGSTVRKPSVRSASGSVRNVYPQRGPYVAKTQPPSRGDVPMKWTGSTVSKPRIQSATGKTRNVFPQQGMYARNTSPQPRQAENPPGTKRKRKAPLTASKPYIRSTSINPYAGFWNQKKKGERAYVGDISGKKLRARNYESPRQEIVESTGAPYLKRKRLGDIAYSGKAAGGHVSATRSPKAWQGDISGRKIRGRNYSSKGKVEAGQPLVGIPPVQGADAGKYQGNIKAGKKVPGKEVGGYPGKHRMFDLHPSMRNQGEEFTGNKKARKPLVGGGSVSGQLWNNNEKPIIGRAPKGNASAMGAYQGNSKASKKEPGKEVGGFPGKYRMFDLHPSMRNQGELFAGHIKARKPQVGGGSVSGKLWNNNEKPIIGRAPKGNALAMAAYQGNIKASRKEPSKEVGGFPGKYRMFDLHSSMRNQGEEFTGHIRVKKLHNDYIRNEYAAKDALLKARPSKGTFSVNAVHVSVKQKPYSKKPNAADGSMKGIAPGRTPERASAYAGGATLNGKYIQNKSSVEKALKVREPGKTFGEVTEYSRGARLNWKYIHNKSSDEDALKVREPGKAFASVTDYQGNIKMKKFDLFARKDLHPDAQFVKNNQNNVKGEKSLGTNVKLFWAKMFKKSDTQPEHLKEKIQKPRYDKGEIGLWYE